MSERLCRVLILDHDPEVLTRLQCVLEDGGVDATVTWDDGEACKLAKSTLFDLILVGDHPPELAAETFLREIAQSAAPRSCLLLGAGESRVDPLAGSGIAGVVPKGDPFRVLQAVREYCRSKKRRVPVGDRSLRRGRLDKAL